MTESSPTQNGSVDSISDLTSAAGWSLVDRVGDDFRFVCTGKNMTCDHLHQNGAVGTMVRVHPEHVSRQRLLADNSLIQLSVI